jgi:hypothetical protein
LSVLCRKLDNKDYELRKALDDRKQLKHKIESLKLDTECAQLYAQITWKDKKVAEHKFNALGENGEYKNDLSISEIKKNKFRCLKGRIIYGVRRDSFYGKAKEWEPDTHIECHRYSCGTFYSDWYIIPIDCLDEFCKLTKSVKDDSELVKLFKTQKEIDDKITKLDKEMILLNKRIEKLNNNAKASNTL